MLNVNVFSQNTLTQVQRFIQNSDDTDGRDVRLCKNRNDKRRQPCSKGTEPEIGILDFLESKAIAKRSYHGVARAVQFLAAESVLRRQKYMYSIILPSETVWFHQVFAID